MAPLLLIEAFVIKLVMSFLLCLVAVFAAEADAAVCAKEFAQLESSFVAEKSILNQMANSYGTAGAAIGSFHDALKTRLNSSAGITEQNLAPLAQSANSFTTAGERNKVLVEKLAVVQNSLIADLKKCLDKSR